jgi:hypothetical protein
MLNSSLERLSSPSSRLFDPTQRALTGLLFRANPHLLLRARQATLHVTIRRSTHPRFTSTSPILTGLYCALHRLASAHPPCLGCTHPRSRGYRERQLLAGRIQGSEKGLLGVWLHASLTRRRKVKRGFPRSHNPLTSVVHVSPVNRILYSV